MAVSVARAQLSVAKPPPCRGLVTAFARVFSTSPINCMYVEDLNEQ